MPEHRGFLKHSCNRWGAENEFFFQFVVQQFLVASRQQQFVVFEQFFVAFRQQLVVEQPLVREQRFLGIQPVPDGFFVIVTRPQPDRLSTRLERHML